METSSTARERSPQEHRATTREFGSETNLLEKLTESFERIADGQEGMEKSVKTALESIVERLEQMNNGNGNGNHAGQPAYGASGARPFSNVSPFPPPDPNAWRYAGIDTQSDHREFNHPLTQLGDVQARMEAQQTIQVTQQNWMISLFQRVETTLNEVQRELAKRRTAA